MADVTLAICTYNRCRILPRAIDSAFRQTACRDMTDILVIDNGSTDETRDVVEAYQREHPNLRYVYEGTPGITHARNRATTETRGEYLAFLDDDAWAEPEWMQALLAAMEKDRYRAACLVGRVVLDWRTHRPGWLPRRADTLLCAYDQGSAEKLLGPRDYLLTTNVLFDVNVLRQLGGFRTDLGRRQGSLLGGEDNDIFHRLIRRDLRVMYVPDALVHHDVPPERVTLPYIARRFFWDGATQPLLDYGSSQPAVFYLKQAIVDVRRSVRFSLLALKAARDRDRAMVVEHTASLIQRLGRCRTNIHLTISRARRS